MSGCGEEVENVSGRSYERGQDWSWRVMVGQTAQVVLRDGVWGLFLHFGDFVVVSVIDVFVLLLCIVSHCCYSSAYSPLKYQVVNSREELVEM